MRTLGRFMQFIALALPPIAVVSQLIMGSEQFRPGQLLIAGVFAAAMFYLGRMIEGYSAGDASKK